jgi:hypothetical protein
MIAVEILIAILPFVDAACGFAGVAASALP